MEHDGDVVGKLLARLVGGQEKALGDDLVGSYLYGSVVTGEFDSRVSDIDTVAVVRANLTDAQLASLERLHRQIVEEMPPWEDRVEVVYLSARALSTFRSGSSAAARISPGEPFHAITVDRRWLIDWYQLRECGVALHGPPPDSLVPVITRDEYREAVRHHMLGWPDWVGGCTTQGAQAYAILTMCRGLRTWRTGEHVSKREAGQWAIEAVPQYAHLIGEALVWRARSRIGLITDGAATRHDTLQFVTGMARLVDSRFDRGA